MRSLAALGRCLCAWVWLGSANLARADLVLELAADPDTIAVGERVQVTYRLHNLGKTAVVGDLCLDPTCGLLTVEITDSSGKSTVYLSHNLLTAFTLSRLPVEQTLEPGGSLEDSLCLLYDARADEFAFSEPGEYLLRAAFSAPTEEVISKSVTIHVTAPIGLAVQALEFIRKEKLEPFLCNEAAYYDVSSKTSAALNALTKKYAKTPYAVGAEEGLRALGVRAKLLVVPSAIFFGDAPVRGGVVGRVVELVNDGGEPLEIRTVVAPERPFSLKEISDFPKTLEPKAHTDLLAEFSPEETGTFRGELRIESSGGSFSVPLDGQGSSAPALSLSDTVVDFGRRTPGEASIKQVTVTNIGLEDLVVESMSPLAQPFRYASELALPWTIPAGMTRTFNVVFAVEWGEFDALIVIRSNDPLYSDARLIVRGEGAEAAGCGCAMGAPIGGEEANILLMGFLCSIWASLWVLRSRRVVTPQGVKASCVGVHDQRIVSVTDYEPVPAVPRVDDVGDSVVMPGLVDTHVHINDPGRADWEGFETATRAAAAGGVTTVVDMPLNARPPTTTVAGLEAKLAAAQGRLYVDCGFLGGVVPDNLDQLHELSRAGVLGFKCFLCPSGVPEFSHVNLAQLRHAMTVLEPLGAVLFIHAELLDDATFPSSRRYHDYLGSRPDAAETSAVATVARLCSEIQARCHIVHVSSASVLSSLRKARDQNISLTAETCPHYLHFTAEQIPDGATTYKCAPPIRGQTNREQLWGGLREGLLQQIVSDHSPAPAALKCIDSGDFVRAWGGIASLGLTLPVVWTEATTRRRSLPEIATWLCERPAQLVGLGARKGAIAPGYDADFCVWDPEREFRVDPAQLEQRHKISPYAQAPLSGVVRATYLRGKKIYQDGRFLMPPSGLWLR